MTPFPVAAEAGRSSDDWACPHQDPVCRATENRVVQRTRRILVCYSHTDERNRKPAVHPKGRSAKLPGGLCAQSHEERFMKKPPGGTAWQWHGGLQLRC